MMKAIILAFCAALITPGQQVVRRPIVTGGGSFPTLGILDNFNRANEGPPPSASWTSIANGGTETVGLNVTSNECKAVDSNLDSAYWNTTLGPDIEAYLTLRTSAGVSSRAGLYFRLVNEGTASANGYLVMARGTAPSNTIRVYKITAGGFTQLGADISQTIASGDSLGVSMVGSTITVYYKSGAGSWTSLTTRTDATYTAAGKVAITLWDDVNATVDDFGGGTI